MPKVQWGKKIVCPSCETRFYDLNRKHPITCPSCGASVEEVNVVGNSSETIKVFKNETQSVNETNLVGSDATESIAGDDSLPLEDVVEDETISLEEVDQDVDVIDTEVDDLSIEQDDNQIEED